jgi:hypothetical protein
VPPELSLPNSARVHLLADRATDDVLQLQMQAVAQANAFVGSYGDLAILAAFCGTPVTAYHSERLPADHPDRVQSAAAAGWGSVSVERARRFKGAEAAGGGSRMRRNQVSGLRIQGWARKEADGISRAIRP